jgi:hypothetical protein
MKRKRLGLKDLSKRAAFGGEDGSGTVALLFITCAIMLSACRNVPIAFQPVT